jgi:uncharacterized protein (DUF1778 family)
MPKSDETMVVTVYCTLEQLARLQAAAKAEGRSVSNLTLTAALRQISAE